MANPVAHFEIYADNPTKLSGFYQSLFGWQINKSQGMDYWTVRTVQTDAKGAPSEPGGINGGLLARPMPDAPGRSWLNYVTVKSVDETLKRAQGLGAKLIRKSSVPKMGWFAILTDPEQNSFAIWQDDPNAK